jgi:aspartyl/asparaginyl beta-hydroxylase (cupin superfamily)
MKNFLNPSDYPFLKTIKDAYPTILDEYNSVIADTQKWSESYLHNGKWDVIGFKFEGKDIPETKKIFPKTNQIFESLKDKIHTCGFSIMRAGCEIYEHVNDNHDVLRCHLCLITNPECALVVNDEIKKWEEGELLVFDDTNRHYAYNRGNKDRIIVLFDFYK